ncbi:unnamed protein product, partial [Iphiclides podalirius]
MFVRVGKVQAQRKFAQGAYIPPANNNNDRKIDQTPQKDTAELRNRNIFHSSSSAKQLLDVVSLQNLHSHIDPFVLLERLNLGTEAPRDSPKSKTMQSEPRMTMRKRRSRYSSPLKTNSHGMRLRSSTRSPSKLKYTYEFCTEDEQPLTYFTKNRKGLKSQPSNDPAGKSDKQAIINPEDPLATPSPFKKSSLSSAPERSTLKNRAGRPKKKSRVSSASRFTTADKSIWVMKQGKRRTGSRACCGAHRTNFVDARCSFMYLY